MWCAHDARWVCVACTGCVVGGCGVHMMPDGCVWRAQEARAMLLLVEQVQQPNLTQGTRGQIQQPNLTLGGKFSSLI